jgi:hypothetical protein
MSLIAKCQEMLKDEYRLPHAKRDHEFIRTVLETIVQLKRQQRQQYGPRPKKSERRDGEIDKPFPVVDGRFFAGSGQDSEVRVDTRNAGSSAVGTPSEIQSGHNQAQAVGHNKNQVGGRVGLTGPNAQ